MSISHRKINLKNDKKQSLKSVSIRILLPLSLILAGLLFFLVWGTLESRKLADKYIQDTARLYVEQINKNIFQINKELIVLINKDKDIAALPAQLAPQDGKYYKNLFNIREQNGILKIRYDTVQSFYVYVRSADVLITDEGMSFHDSLKSTFNAQLMTLLYENAAADSMNPQWVLMNIDGGNYIVSYYVKRGKAIGCIMQIEEIFKTLSEATESYQVIPFMEQSDGEIIMSDKAFKTYGEEILAGGRKNSRIYAYQLGNLGQVSMYVLPDGGVLENILDRQILLVILIFILLFICVLVGHSYNRRVMEPMKRFVDGLDEINEQQMLNENGNNSLLELEAASDRFRDLLRKIQSLKIAIYEEELMKQQAELEYAIEQTRPHFFLNCLSLIHGIADKSDEKQIIYITEILSDYMRYLFKDSGGRRCVEEELTHVQRYIEIQKLRYGEDAFAFEVIMDEDINDCEIPSLLLQTLVENAVVHEVTLDCAIEISLYLTYETYEDGKYLYICVSDTGKGFTKEVLEAIDKDSPIVYHGRKHVGLQNLRRRLILMYGKQAKITFSNMDEGFGAVVEVRIPLS